MLVALLSPRRFQHAAQFNAEFLWIRDNVWLTSETPVLSKILDQLGVKLMDQQMNDQKKQANDF